MEHASIASVCTRLRAQRIIPVLRLESASAASEAVSCLHEAGARVFEITMTTPGALELIADLARGFPDSLIGAGTIYDLSVARQCLDRGARFLVSPCTINGMSALAHGSGGASLQGAFTPGEVLAALGEGADVVKIFPASTGGPQHVAALRAIFPAAHFCPTGGINAENVAGYFAAGASMVGIGNNIVDRTALDRGDRAAAIAHARRLFDAS